MSSISNDRGVLDSSQAEPWRSMQENFAAASASAPKDHKSAHWDVFPENYADILLARDAWPEFLRNSISVGFNDGLVGVPDRWQRRRNGDLRPLVPPVLAPEAVTAGLIEQLKHVLDLCGIKFFRHVMAPELGSPQRFSILLSDVTGSAAVPTDIAAHDIHLVYYAWQLFRTVRQMQPQPRTFIDIGGGYGELIAKMKTLFPSAKCIMIDLPENNAVQAYYLYHRFPGAKFLYYNDIMARGGVLSADEDFDFLILPGWMTHAIPDDFIDCVVSTRAFQEMEEAVVAHYFAELHRMVAPNGLFYLVNRYRKSSPTGAIEFARLPYDERWRPLLSHPCVIQPNCHEMICQRTSMAEPFPVRHALMALRGTLAELVFQAPIAAGAAAPPP